MTIPDLPLPGGGMAPSPLPKLGHLNKSQRAMVVARETMKVAEFRQAVMAKVYSEQAGITIAYTNWALRLLRQAAPHIVKMVDDDKVNVKIAAEALGELTPDQQIGLTVADVDRLGRAHVAQYPSNKAKAKAKGKGKHRHIVRPGAGRPGPLIDPPMLMLRKLTDEEIGLPPGATLEQRWAHAAIYGRVQTVPKLVKDAQNHTVKIESLMAALRVLTDAPAPSEVAAGLAALLAWKPRPDLPKAHGWHTDYARQGRRQLAELHVMLAGALAQLSEVQRLLAVADAQATLGGCAGGAP